jgi:hypothetical protein
LRTVTAAWWTRRSTISRDAAEAKAHADADRDFGFMGIGCAGIDIGGAWTSHLLEEASVAHQEDGSSANAQEPSAPGDG